MDRFRKGLIFKIIGAILIAVGLLGLIAAKGLSTEPGFEDRGLLLVLGAAVSVGLAVAGSSLFARGRKLRFRLADDEPLDEGTPFVLYLRSFASEFKTNAPAGGPNQDAFPNVLRFAKVGVRLYHVIFALFVICLVGMISLSMYFGKKAPSESRHTSTRSPSRIEVENSNARR